MKLEVELERIVLTEIWRESAVLKTIVEKAETSAGNELRAHLIRKTKSRREIGLLRGTQPLAVTVGD